MEFCSTSPAFPCDRHLSLEYCGRIQEKLQICQRRRWCLDGESGTRGLGL